METMVNEDWNTLVFKNVKDFSCSYTEVFTSPNEQFIALSLCETEDFDDPIVMYFEQIHLQHLINFNFKFPVDVILVNVDGLVVNTFTEPFRDSSASYIRGFSDLKMVVLCPEHFIANNRISKKETRVELVSYYNYIYDEETDTLERDENPMTIEEIKWSIGRHVNYND